MAMQKVIVATEERDATRRHVVDLVRPSIMAVDLLSP